MHRSATRARANPASSIAKACLVIIAQLPRLNSHPLVARIVEGTKKEHFPAEPPSHADFWINIIVATVLVLLGGVFAGLTLALMGQDEIYLQVMEQSGEPQEKKDAKRVLRLLKRGKHWVLVALLLSNVITNETLPIVLDRSLGGGWSAVLISTVAIVIFGEIIPQSICVRYGLAIGAKLSPFVLALMYLMYPVAYPIALLLDKLLGEDHGTVYKKSGLKTLVTLHKTLGPSPSDRLNQDEVTIITAVLDLKEKSVESIMTPISDVFTMSADTILDEPTTDAILRAGYSRIPIHQPGEPFNFIGMLLVKILITYDPEDCMKVSEFSLATLPETAADTSCLDIVNFFQEGKSHMVLVSEHPGENYGALGVVTLEDVIEELIGEEIVDESDVYIDVHKAIRRINPSPLFRRSISSAVNNRGGEHAHEIAQTTSAVAGLAGVVPSTSVVKAEDDGSIHVLGETDKSKVPTAADKINKQTAINPEILAHLKHLGPSNLASNPRTTSSRTIKIKAGTGAVPAAVALENPLDTTTTTQSDPRGYGATDATSALVDLGGENGTLGKRKSAQSSPGFSQHRSYSNSASPDGSRAGSPSNLEVPRIKKLARSGSLVETIKTRNGIPKTVIETTSSEDNDDESPTSTTYAGVVKGKKRRGTKSRHVEEQPLLDGEESKYKSD